VVKVVRIFRDALQSLREFWLAKSLARPVGMTPPTFTTRIWPNFLSLAEFFSAMPIPTNRLRLFAS